MSGIFFAPYFTPFVALRPKDVAPLNPHELKMLLKPLEHRESGIASFFREPLCLPFLNCKVLDISVSKKAETTKRNKLETKKSKPHNENICLTNPNVTNNGNFPILAFGDSTGRDIE